MDSIRLSINKDLLKTETTLSFYVTVLAENGWDENDTEIYTFTTTQNIDISSIISIDHPEWTPKPTEEALEEPSDRKSAG